MSALSRPAAAQQRSPKVHGMSNAHRKTLQTVELGGLEIDYLSMEN